MKLSTELATSPSLFKLDIESPPPKIKYDLHGLCRELNLWGAAAPHENRRSAADAILQCWHSRNEHLDLSGNGLTSLPGAVGALSHIKALNLASNALTALPDECFELRALEYFNLSYNPLEHLPGAIGKLTELRHLFLDGVKMADYPCQIFDLPRDCTVYFRDAALSEIHAQELKVDIVEHPIGPHIETRSISRLKRHYSIDRRSPNPTGIPPTPSPEIKIIGFKVGESSTHAGQTVQK